MANFSPNLSYSTIGLCATLVATDFSNYLDNTDDVSEASVRSKVWIFRDSSGNIIKQETTLGNVYSSSCSISLLTLNISVTLILSVLRNGVYQTYSIQSGVLIPCLGI